MSFSIPLSMSISGLSRWQLLLRHTLAFDPGLLLQFARISLFVTKLISSKTLNALPYSYVRLAKEINRNEF